MSEKNRPQVKLASLQELGVTLHSTTEVKPLKFNELTIGNGIIKVNDLIQKEENLIIKRITNENGKIICKIGRPDVKTNITIELINSKVEKEGTSTIWKRKGTEETIQINLPNKEEISKETVKIETKPESLITQEQTEKLEIETEEILKDLPIEKTGEKNLETLDAFYKYLGETGNEELEKALIDENEEKIKEIEQKLYEEFVANL